MSAAWWSGTASKLEVGAPLAMLALWLFLGRQFIGDVATEASRWAWIQLGLWVFVVIGTSWECVNVIRRRRADPTPTSGGE
ncbi:hypothetical protein ACGFIU_09355 [Rhodococcus oryzae]|uniref:hypothetical protein n=1 Tax=Rhodococcus oryzae TaxID=2571143 RepID=UPI003719987D